MVGLHGPCALRAPAGPTRPWYRGRISPNIRRAVSPASGTGRGARPRGVRQQGFSSARPFGAVCPERGEGIAPVPPGVPTAATDLFPAEPSRAVPAGSRAGLALEGAGPARQRGPGVPADLT